MVKNRCILIHNVLLPITMPSSVIGRFFSLKTATVLLLFCSSMLCHAENNDAPAKFYDNLPIKTITLTPRYYIVQPNESLSAIAARYGFNYLKLAQWNDIPAPYAVIDGQKLKLFDEKNITPQKQATSAKVNDELSIKTASTPPKYYTVQPNESLSAIAARYGFNYLKLAQWNDIPAPYAVIEGQKLRLFDEKNLTLQKPFIPAKVNDESSIKTASTPPKYYTVQPNESLSAIAARYGFNYIKLAQWNDISAPYAVIDGQKLKLFEDANTIPDKNTAKIHRKNEELLEQELDRATAVANQEQIAETKTTQSESSSASTDLNIDSDKNGNDLIEYYLVEKDESLSAIALHFGVTSEEIAVWNDIDSPNQLYAGQKLKIFKNKQKHSVLKTSKPEPEITEISRDNSQKTSIISINNKSMLKFYCHWPTNGKVIKKFSQTGGRGIEIGGKTGQVIKATAAGRVVAVSRGIYGHGGFIVIQHSNFYLSSYANNRRSLVKNGQSVAQGEVIAEMGQVGHNPPALEFEIRHHGKTVDPMRFLPKKI